MTPGMIVAERYRLERLLGEGGMGAVWAATHVVTRKTVAIKVLKLELAHNASLVERFLREARAACAVKHPHVVQIHDVLQLPGGAPVMVMDLLDGESLGERLVREGRIPIPEFSRIMLQVISAVSAAHAARVVHRDLKPDNLFLSRTDDGSIDLKVLDFGIAKVSTTDEESGVLTKTGSMLGTPFYMAPEQLFGEKDVDGRADIWSLGIIAYECLTGRRPTEADNLGQIIKVVTTTGIAPLETVAPHVPPDVCAVVGRMLTSDRSKRLSDLAEARAVFERYAGATRSAPSTGGLHALADPARQSGHMRMMSDAPTAAAPATGPLHWAATQPDPPKKTSSGLAWKISAAAAAVVLLGSTIFIVPLLRTSTGRPAASGAPAPASAPPSSAVGGHLEPSEAPSTRLEPPVEPVTSTNDAGASSAAPLAGAAASSRGSSVGTGPRPSRSSTPPASAAAAATPPPTPSHGMLVDKPPF